MIEHPVRVFPAIFSLFVSFVFYLLAGWQGGLLGFVVSAAFAAYSGDL